MNKSINRERIANIIAGISTVLILIIAFFANWRFNVTYLLERIISFLELIAWMIGLSFGIAIIFVIIRLLIIGALDFVSWFSGKFNSNK